MRFKLTILLILLGTNYVSSQSSNEFKIDRVIKINSIELEVILNKKLSKNNEELTKISLHRENDNISYFCLVYNYNIDKKKDEVIKI